MPRKSNTARSRIENLGSNAQKRPSVTIEDVEDEGDFNPVPASIDQGQSDSENLGEAYRNTSKTNNIVEMEKNMLACLDDIPLLQIRRSFFPSFMLSNINVLVQF
jgi:hypothetical protein